MTTPLHLLTVPLDGVQLIEASAGTGKTYTISGLYVRLVLEKRLPVHQILVVTFTRAATEELKMRILKRLQEVRQALAQGGGSGDDFVDGIVVAAGGDAQAIRRIDVALAEFDRAAIFTIHGFCQRVLQEHAFETGSPYETRLVPDPSPMLTEIADDFWRINICRAPTEFIAYLTSQKRIVDPQYFTRFLSVLPQPPFEMTPSPVEPSMNRLQPYRDLMTHLAQDWHAEQGAVTALLKKAPLNGRLYGTLQPASPNGHATKRDVVLAGMAEAMCRFLHPIPRGFPLFDGFSKFCQTRIRQATVKSKSPPEHPFFDLCDRVAAAAAALQNEFETYLRFLHTSFYDYAHRQQAQRKKDANALFYDDLLTAVRNGLMSHGSIRTGALQTALKRQYKAALVDEFQDTDVLQYDIFKSLFADGDALFFMIGDPKQSIYSFRGADIFTYMQAAKAAPTRYNLVRNWRSRPQLIEAVNALFGNVPRPFIFDDIPYDATRPGVGDHHPEHRAELSPGLHLWHLVADDGHKYPKSEVVPKILHAVVQETFRLAYDRTPFVTPDKVAVLVRTNRQARLVKDAFARCGIPSVIHSTGNVFDTPEAKELRRFLSAVLEPANDRRLRAALVSQLIGIDSQALSDCESGAEATVEGWRRAFQTYQAIWRSHGLMAMFHRFLTEHQVRARLLSLTGGERKLTNLLHLMEMLHDAARHLGANPRSQLRWFNDRIRQRHMQDDEHLLRLENDASGVNIVTIHKSKGLEYEVVFCPFAWEGISPTSDDVIVYHEGGVDGRRVVDMGTANHGRARQSAAREALAESLRLLYVAVTRAKTCCYLIWGRINTSETSALAYLIHPDAQAGREADPVRALKSYMESLEHNDHMKALESLTGRSSGAVMLYPLPARKIIPVVRPVAAKAQLTFRSFSGRLTNRWDVASYSSMVMHRSADTARDRDAIWLSDVAAGSVDNSAQTPDEETAANPLFGFPKGARTGLFFHELLERVDFTHPADETQSALITAMLSAYGYDPRWQRPIRHMIDQLRALSLRADNTGPFLSAVDQAKRINEMAFTFPVSRIQSRDIIDVLAKEAPQRLPSRFIEKLDRLTFSSLHGFLKGYIDMVFEWQDRYFLVDWKSNYLGNRLQDYQRSELSRPMSDALYYLQAYIYALALNRHLSQKISNYRYSLHFGGIFFIFIRGVDAAKGPHYGIVEIQPSQASIQRLNHLMMPETPNNAA